MGTRRVSSRFLSVLRNIFTNLFWSDSPDTMLAFLAVLFVLWAWCGQYAQVDGVLQVVLKLLTSIANRKLEQFYLIRDTGTVMLAIASYVYWLIFVFIIWLFVRLVVVLSKKREKELAGSINGLRQQISELQTSGIKISGLDEISSLRDQIIGLRNDLKSWHRKDDDNKPDSEQIKSAL